jgi:hypothetical protein
MDEESRERQRWMKTGQAWQNCTHPDQAPLVWAKGVFALQKAKNGNADKILKFFGANQVQSCMDAGLKDCLSRPQLLY